MTQAKTGRTLLLATLALTVIGTLAPATANAHDNRNDNHHDGNRAPIARHDQNGIYYNDRDSGLTIRWNISDSSPRYTHDRDYYVVPVYGRHGRIIGYQRVYDRPPYGKAHGWHHRH